MVEYKIKYFNISKNEDIIKHFESRNDFYRLYNCLLGHTNVKDLKGYKYDFRSRRYKEIKV